MRNIKVISFSLTLSLSLLLAVFLLSSCDDVSTNKQQTTNQQYIASTVSGNASHDSLIATSLGTLIDDGVVIDSILFIGIDSTGSLGVVVLDDQDEEHTSVSIFSETSDEDMDTAKRLCRCPPNHFQPPFPGQCFPKALENKWICDGPSCCSYTTESVNITILGIGMAALNTMSYVPSVTTM
jgi:hypothetical protein